MKLEMKDVLTSLSSEVVQHQVELTSTIDSILSDQVAPASIRH